MKHAFLIIAHNNFEVLKYQLKLLDAPNTAFFLHIDKRAKFNQEEFKECVKWAPLKFIYSKKIKWGHYSQIDCEMRLLKEAADGQYDYYHLISGVDMPLHPIKEMDAFFVKHRGTEFIHFDTEKVDKSVIERISLYHVNPGRKQWQRKINGFFIKIQRCLKINRLKNNPVMVQKGSNWFSITNDLVQSLIRDEKKIKSTYRWSCCGDEIFLQSYVYNSPFKENLYSKKLNNDYKMCLRLIDWKRGNPYIFQLNDYEELIHSECMFARKFDYKEDSIIVKKLYYYLNSKK